MTLLLLLACTGRPAESTDTDSPADADTDTDSDTDTDTDSDTDTDTDTDTDPTCDPSALAAYVPVEVQVLQVPPSVTARDGEVIHDTLQGTYKEHYVVRRDDGGYDRQELFVWLAGSGGEPQNYQWILNMAASSGYLAVSLAYDNETQVADICAQSDSGDCSPANVACEGDVRQEMVYGTDSSTCLEVPEADSIVNRITRLLQFAQLQYPDGGFERYLSEDGESVDWTHIAVGGWSQGGGHAGILSRDHLVARALFASKGAGAVGCTQIYSEAECDADGNGTLEGQEYVSPAPWASEPRLTPGSREFGAIHTEEDAWLYSRETFDIFGMPGASDPLSIDALGPYPEAYTDYGCSHVFATSATPSCGDNDYHKSMASDACLALDEDGVPVLAPAYVYALTLPVE